MITNSTVTDEIHSHGLVIYKITGTSVLPMLAPNRDIVCVCKKGKSAIKKDDVILFRSKQGLVLHRVIKVINGIYVTMGDNCSKPTQVTEDCICGVLTEFWNNGHKYLVSDDRYIDYINRLNANRNSFIRKKKFVDLIVWHIRFFPYSSREKLKNLLRTVLKLNNSF